VYEKSTHSKVDAPKMVLGLSTTASPVDQTGGAFLFTLVSLIEKGKQCNNQTTKGYQQADNPYKYQNDICICHEHHLPSYVFRQAGFSLAREATTLSWVLFRI
jgi:hypothetical protein